MGVRTIVEVNHDQAHELRLADIRELVDLITNTSVNRELNAGRAVHVAPGVRVLERRESSEGLTVICGNHQYSEV